MAMAMTASRGLCALSCLVAMSLALTAEPGNDGVSAAIGDTCQRDHALLALPASAAGWALRRPTPPAQHIGEGRALAPGSFAKEPGMLLSQVRALAVARISHAAADQTRRTNGDNGGEAESGEGGSPTQAMATILELLESDILSEMRRQHSIQQGEIQDRVRYIKECADSLGAKDATLNKLAQGVSEARANHTTCRGREAELLNATETSCRQLHTYLQAKRVEHSCQLSDSISAANLWNHMTCVDIELQKKSETAEALFGKCNTSTHDHRTTLQECNEQQDAYEEIYCNMTATSVLVCSTYDDCYDRETKHYQEFKPKVEEEGEARRHQAVAVERIQCYVLTILQAEQAELAKEGEGDRRLTQCDALVDQAPKENFTITYQSEPEMATCTWRDWMTDDGVKCAKSDVEPDLTPVSTTSPTPETAGTTVPPPTPTPESKPNPTGFKFELDTAYSGGSKGSWASLDEAKVGCENDPACHGFYRAPGGSVFYRGQCAKTDPNCCDGDQLRTPSNECGETGEAAYGGSCKCKVKYTDGTAAGYEAWVK